MTEFLDEITQFLTASPLWVQAPIMLVFVIPLCALLAYGWLRSIDAISVYLSKIGAKVGKHHLREGE
ncbi:hypothetical protein [Corynebacterium kutscheri]|uniref:Or membrane protein n=1 Tax=Corynebacterium kutscheri TaxID=35755 RepID=A0AB38VVG8_9CORY|nr:hypothetical protein [Corynebacterium kutscheri]VEH06765.1 or membrane protein [Corynebacterium kutscheri]